MGGSCTEDGFFGLLRWLHADALHELSCSLPTDRAMEEVFAAHYCSLHVRVTNRGAFHLYTQTLGYS